MEKLFDAIRKSNIELVKDLISSDASLVNSISIKGLEKDNGQSPLQVAIKTNNIDIANYLIDNNANVNFIEKDSTNEWKALVIHDALRTAIMNTRWNTFDGNIKVFHTKEESDKAFSY